MKIYFKIIRLKKKLFLLLLVLMASCIEKMALPDEINTNVDFSAGDTTYLAISPVWDESFGLQTPVEISIAEDGHIFIADSGAHSILVLSQSGSSVEGYDNLKQLSTPEGSELAPVDVDVDKKMNVFFIDGSQRIYRWNLIWNDFGIESVAQSGTFYSSNQNETLQLSTSSDNWIEVINSNEWVPLSFTWSTTEIRTIDSLLTPHIFYDGAVDVHSFKDHYYLSDSSKFTGLAAAKDESDFIYVLDGYHHRMMRIDFERTHLLKLTTGDSVWVHRGVFGHTAVGSGSGAGTIDQPTGMDVDDDGNIYYAQLGESFAVHKVRPVSAGAWMIYPSVFQPGANEIMDLWDTTLVVNQVSVDTFLTRFNTPYDVSSDQNQYVYIANTGAREVQVYNASGEFFLKAGVETITVDTTIWVISGNDSTSIDTFFVKEFHDDLISPRALTVDNRGMIYVCDPEQSSIFRYQLSNQLDEDLQPIQ
jgi:hypothetical protein